MLWSVRGSFPVARSAGTCHLAWKYVVFIHADFWTLSLIFIHCFNLFWTLVTACKVHVASALVTPQQHKAYLQTNTVLTEYTIIVRLIIIIIKTVF